ncbi:MAG TPA: hypothetical protein VFB34_01140 [Chloroflexota bacterium]|nr:hypothetical protein [Chloroflexota bacterium]
MGTRLIYVPAGWVMGLKGRTQRELIAATGSAAGPWMSTVAVVLWIGRPYSSHSLDGTSTTVATPQMNRATLIGRRPEDGVRPRAASLAGTG